MKLHEVWTSLVLICFSTVTANRLSLLKNVDDFMNTCMDGQNHKLQPGPEELQFQTCFPWKDRACCSKDVTAEFQSPGVTKWLGFEWNHCGGMTEKCRKHFIQDLCFYECSPNVGPWLVKDSDREWRKERMFEVPLCESECLTWWDDCKEEMTCLDNWMRGFNWTTGTNTCPDDMKCQPFKDMFKDHRRFCEQVWDFSYKVVPDGDDNCFKLWFDPKDYNGSNPNDAVARKKAQAYTILLSSNLATLICIPVVSVVAGLLSAIVLL
ncbi:unnamed protein product [Owenia fusiformis]|uniref:Uncharacterized protein n=1 Tax=Owenia fusiformis TaxID=6347 RepID=A0A8J1TH70_OWEFU|nr:unnamed protein product [Owenia fusiformis]